MNETPMQKTMVNAKAAVRVQEKWGKQNPVKTYAVAIAGIASPTIYLANQVVVYRRVSKARKSRLTLVK